eukprot:scaffold11042_cov98-Phaeocystis_antarctica.AAC.3
MTIATSIWPIARARCRKRPVSASMYCIRIALRRVESDSFWTENIGQSASDIRNLVRDDLQVVVRDDSKIVERELAPIYAVVPRIGCHDTGAHVHACSLQWADNALGDYRPSERDGALHDAI